MRNVLPVSLIAGALAGLLVGGYFNVFNVPVMEWAISLEQAAAADDVEPQGEAVYDFLGSLGMQRIGLIAGLVVIGVLFGAIFTGLYHLIRQAMPGWNEWAWALIAGLLGFWALSLLPQLKYPLNPPGVGEEASLLGRQGFQFLFILLSLAAAAAGCWAVRFIRQLNPGNNLQPLTYVSVVIAYLAAVAILFYAIPGNPDPIPEWMPEALVIMFRTFSLLGHLLLWLLIALGVVGYRSYKSAGIKAYSGKAAEANLD